ncbi:MAG: DsbA family oxidoreductase [Rubrivivax sp.]|nr:DsbA family oxidoreductase [Rubrivivax sp.]MDH5338309.1 DsbA family oxidoreductase [Rubrivivax sp.]
MRIDFVSDVACPWCAVGLHGLERALQTLGDGVPVELHFQPFELNPDLGPEGREVVPYLAEKYGKTPEQVRQTQAMIRDRGAEVGFAFGERTHTWNTFDAHRLLHWAGLQGRQRELKHALLAAYHGQGRNPSAADVLLDCAVQAGLDADAARVVIEGKRYADEVRAEERRWQQLGIHSVPSIVIDGRHLIQGGQPPAVYEQALRQIAAEG